MVINKFKIEEQKEILQNSILPEDKKKSAIEVLDFILSITEKQLDFLLSDKEAKSTMNLFSIELGNSEEVLAKLKDALKRI